MELFKEIVAKNGAIETSKGLEEYEKNGDILPWRYARCYDEIEAS